MAKSSAACRPDRKDRLIRPGKKLRPVSAADLAADEAVGADTEALP